MAATLKDLYEAFDAGASRETLLRLIEDLERQHITIPPELRQEITEMVDLSTED